MTIFGDIWREIMNCGLEEGDLKVKGICRKVTLCKSFLILEDFCDFAAPWKEKKKRKTISGPTET